jgi:diketogulonate reductase-like aldo/keto reductase
MTSRLTRREALALLAMSSMSASGSSEFLGVPRKSPEERGGTEALRGTRIGLGTWQTFDVGQAESARKPLEEVLSLFVQLGGRVVDSSPMYGRSEEVLGDLAVKLGVRDELFMATKVWTSGRVAGIRQMEESERRLRGRVDLMQVHNLVDVDTHLKTLKEWKAQKRIRSIGITHYTSSAYDDLAEVLRRGGIDFVQLNYSLAEREAELSLLPLAQKLGVAVLVNRPFGAGSLFRETRGKAVPAFAKEIGCTSWAELFLKFVVSHPAVTCAIPATSKAEHLRQNMRAGTGPMPDAAMRKRIAEAVG